MTVTSGRYFSENELACPCCGESKMDVDFVRYLDQLREDWGEALIVTSGYRCKKHNAAIGGARNSAHLQGKAADILMSSQAHGFLSLVFDSEVFTGVGIKLNGSPGRRFIHIDTSDGVRRPAVWTY